MSAAKIIQVIHVAGTDQYGAGLLALCENGEMLSGTLGYVHGQLIVEWTHMPAVDVRRDTA